MSLSHSLIWKAIFSLPPTLSPSLPLSPLSHPPSLPPSLLASPSTSLPPSLPPSLPLPPLASLSLPTGKEETLYISFSTETPTLRPDSNPAQAPSPPPSAILTRTSLAHTSPSPPPFHTGPSPKMFIPSPTSDTQSTPLPPTSHMRGGSPTRSPSSTFSPNQQISPPSATTLRTSFSTRPCVCATRSELRERVLSPGSRSRKERRGEGVESLPSSGRL